MIGDNEKVVVVDTF